MPAKKRVTKPAAAACSKDLTPLRDLTAAPESPDADAPADAPAPPSPTASTGGRGNGWLLIPPPLQVICYFQHHKADLR